MTGPAPPLPHFPRRRTKRACLNCRRKKLKCNGLQPCATCTSRNITCAYNPGSPDMSRAKAAEHTSTQSGHWQQSLANVTEPRANEHMLDSFNFDLSPSRPLAATQRSGTAESISGLAPRSSEQGYQANPGNPGCQLSHVLGTSLQSASIEVPITAHVGAASRNAYGNSGARGEESLEAQKQAKDRDEDNEPKLVSRGGSGERLNEQSRLLNDGKGRLLYLGDSASLSFLDTIRRLVENTLGPSDFTRDPHRHKLVEGSITVAKKPTHVLPDREAAEFLIDSFFSNTVGILYILDREACAREVAQIYENPLCVEQSRLSILNLLFAVGLQMTRSSAAHSFRESQILKRLDAGPVDRAELFYLNATYLNDPMQGFEDGDITSIQALLLITVFMLTVAKRNAAWAYFGMAVRSAYALGLHRKETDLGFAPSEQRMRRNIWKSLYVMDCFISAMLGRANGINSRDAPQSSYQTEGDDVTEEGGIIETDALTASVRASQLIGDILSYVYAERKISVKLAHHLSSRFQAWKTSLPPILHWQNISLPNEDPRTTLAQLHVNLSYFHGIILLTRPFLLQKIISMPQGRNQDRGNQAKTAGKEETSSASAEAFPPACVRSAVYSIDAVQSALLKRALPRRDPFVIYWLFSASLIVFSNGFANVCSDVDTNRAMQTALNLHQYLGEVDPLARRYNQILVAFHAAISRKETVLANQAPTTTRPSSENIFNAFFGGLRTDRQVQVGPGSLDHRRNSNSQATSTAMNNSGITPSMSVAADWQPFFQLPPMQTSSLAGAMITGGQGGAGVTGGSTGISPPDYCLDFDAFLNNMAASETVGQTQDIYGQDSWMPLYGTMDVG